uniref:GIY-YIG nuclease family protein n=2 Tax=uncultured Megasphaera sp. TaxID=165188 RepID=UPI0027DE5C9A
MPHGKSIELFLVNGTADSIITAELSNWNGKAIKIPRIEVAACKRDDVTEVGVYFLFGKDDDNADIVYIGESENVKERLVQHIRDYPDKEKFYWNTAVIFIGHDLNKALIRYLENRFVEIARKTKRYTVVTKNTYRNTVMKESQVAMMEEFIEDVQILLNTLGYKVLEPLVEEARTADPVAPQPETGMLSITSGNVNATGKVTAEGFVVLEGAAINEKISERSLSAGAIKQRADLLKLGKVKNWVTTENILFIMGPLSRPRSKILRVAVS